jgi:hypothetical protein
MKRLLSRFFFLREDFTNRAMLQSSQSDPVSSFLIRNPLSRGIRSVTHLVLALTDGRKLSLSRISFISRLKTHSVGPPFVSRFPAYTEKMSKAQFTLRCVETPGFPIKTAIFHRRCVLRPLYP